MKVPLNRGSSLRLQEYPGLGKTMLAAAHISSRLMADRFVGLVQPQLAVTILASSSGGLYVSFKSNIFHFERGSEKLLHPSPTQSSNEMGGEELEKFLNR